MAANLGVEHLGSFIWVCTLSISLIFFYRCMFSLNNLDLFVSGVDVKTQEEVALKLVSEVVMDSCHSNFYVGMPMGRVLVDTIPVCPLARSWTKYGSNFIDCTMILNCGRHLQLRLKYC